MNGIQAVCEHILMSKGYLLELFAVSILAEVTIVQR